MIPKHCYVRLDEDFHVLHDNRYIAVVLCKNDAGDMMCGLTGADDWELSYTAPDAEAKFNALLETDGEISYNRLLALGFTQYG